MKGKFDVILEKWNNKLINNEKLESTYVESCTLTGNYRQAPARFPGRAGFFLNPNCLVRMLDNSRIHMRELVFHLLGQVLSATNPVAGLTGAGGFVMAQMLVQRLDKIDALTQ